MSPETKSWWAQITRDFQFEPHQRRILIAAAQSWDRMEQARKALVEHGLTYRDDKHKIFSQPEVAIERDCRAAFLRAMRELDLEKAPSEELRIRGRLPLGIR